MSIFVQVNSVDFGCPIILNLDEILQIVPLREGGCAIFTPDAAAVGGKSSFKVSDSYELFKQFVVQTVTPDDIANRIAKLNIGVKEQHPRFISDNEEPVVVKRPVGRPPKSSGMVTSADITGIEP